MADRWIPSTNIHTGADMVRALWMSPISTEGIHSFVLRRYSIIFNITVITEALLFCVGEDKYMHH